MSELRDLAQQFAAGRIDTEEYRKRRRHVLDALAQGDQRPPHRAPPPPRRWNPWLMVGVVLVLVITAILLW